MKILYLIIICCILLLTGCYNQRKATSQFSRAAVAYPEILTKTCSDKYPARTDTVHGKDIEHIDTIYTGTGEIVTDTVVDRHMDTIRYYYTTKLPGTVITRTIVRTDTIYAENTAALALCGIVRDNAVLAQNKVTVDRDKWKKIAKKRFWIILGMGAAMALGIFAMIRRKVVKKVVP